MTENKENYEWIECKDELPLQDGLYEISYYPEGYPFRSVASYDGYGFLVEGIYRSPLYWHGKKPLIKKYGKQKND